VSSGETFGTEGYNQLAVSGVDGCGANEGECLGAGHGTLADGRAVILIG